MVERGCGSERNKESLYMEIPQDLLGFPLEYFMCDPPIPWEGEHLRAPMPYTVTYPNGEEVTHLVLGIGKMYYGSAAAYLEECRKYGMSKKIPIRSIPWERLEPGKSHVWLIHPRGIPQFSYQADYVCPMQVLKRKKEHLGQFLPPEKQEEYALRITYISHMIEKKLEAINYEEEHTCLGAVWPLASLINGENHQVYKQPDHIPQTVLEKTDTSKDELQEQRVMVAVWNETGPAYTFTVTKPTQWETPLSWKPAVILKFPIKQFAYITDREVPPKWLKKEMKASEKNWDLLAKRE